jgi:hypothetical protein
MIANRKALETKTYTREQLLEALEIAKGYILLYKNAPEVRANPRDETACTNATFLLNDASHYVYTRLGPEVGVVLAVERYL